LQTPLRILIVGGGIAGTTLANLLEQIGVAPVLVEKEPQWSNHGYALALWPLGARILRGLGLYQAFRDLSRTLEWYRILDRDGRLVHSIRLQDHLSPADMIGMISREDLLHLLASHLRATDVRFNATPDRIEPRADGVEVRFVGGARATYDLVIGADGISSDVRRDVCGPVPVTDTGWAGWAWWARDHTTPKDTVTEHWAPGRFLETYSTRDATSVLAAMPARLMPGDPRHPSPDAIRTVFSGFGGAAHQVLAALRADDRVYHWAFTDVRTPVWYRGRIALLGDASSALLPSAGVGASCAMESAAVLADELRRVDRRTVTQALPLYFKRRFKRVDHMQRESRLVARLMFTESSVVCRLRDFILRTTPFAERRLRAINALLDQPL
jgi:2-polyprenyl-6-methoxyphenol hydroxylase-like FAD-dependent oxidoreductase